MINPNAVMKEYRMKINAKKTKVTCISREGNSKVHLDDQEVNGM